MVINHTIKLATLDHIKNKYKWDPSLWDLKDKVKMSGYYFQGRIGLLFIHRVLIYQSLYKVYDIPLFQYEREDNRRVDLEVVMVRARKGGRTSWPLPENKKRL